MPVLRAGTDGTCQWTGLRGLAAGYGGRRRGAGCSALPSRHRRSRLGGVVGAGGTNCSRVHPKDSATRMSSPEALGGGACPALIYSRQVHTCMGHNGVILLAPPCPAARGRKVAAAAAAAVAPADDATGGASSGGRQRLEESQPPLQWVGSFLGEKEEGRRPQPPASVATPPAAPRCGTVWGTGGVVQVQKGWRRQPSPLYSSQTDPTAGARPTSDSPRQPRRRRLPADSPARRRPLRWGGGRHHRWRR